MPQPNLIETVKSQEPQGQLVNFYDYAKPEEQIADEATQGVNESKERDSAKKSSVVKIWDYLANENDGAVAKGRLRSFLNFCFPSVVKDEKEKPKWGLPDIAAKICCYANFFGAFLEVLPNVSKKVINFVETANKWITRFGFLPFGADGFLTGARKKNIIAAASCLLEPVCAFIGDLTNMYWVRRLAVGLEQLPYAHEHKTGAEFKSFGEGLKKVPKAILEIGLEMIKNPFKTLLTKDQKGHLALLSTIGDLISFSGFVAFGEAKEKLFGFIGDVSGAIFDVAALFEKAKSARTAGKLFLAEAGLDFTARFAGKNRMAVNQLAHGVGRLALEYYKNGQRENLEIERKEKAEQDVESETPANIVRLPIPNRAVAQEFAETIDRVAA